MLINNVEELRELMPSIMPSADFSKFKGALLSSENRLKNILGDEIYSAAIADIYMSESCRTIVGAGAYYAVIPELDIVNSPNGFAVVSDQKLAPASKDRVSALREAVRLKGEEAEILLFENLEDSSELRGEWELRQRTTIITDSLIPTLRDFERFAKFDGGYGKWREQRFRHREIITMKIAPVISPEVVKLIIAGNDRYDDVANQIRASFVALFVNQTETAGAILTEVHHRMADNAELYPEFAASRQNYKYQTVASSTGVGIFGL